MSVLIRGIEMPKNCIDCDLAATDDYRGLYCPFTGIDCLNIGRQKYCPLVEVPDDHTPIDALLKAQLDFANALNKSLLTELEELKTKFVVYEVGSPIKVENVEVSHER